MSDCVRRCVLSHREGRKGRKGGGRAGGVKSREAAAGIESVCSADQHFKIF